MKTKSKKTATELVIKRHYNKKELRVLCGNVSLYFLNRLIKKVRKMGPPMGMWYSPAQIMMLLNRYGLEGAFAENQKKHY